MSSVAVLGGGLAGMAAAWRLSRLGHDVTLVERRPYLGGRAFSFTDRESGVQVDNGQHVFLGCCTEYVQFLDEMGTLHLTHRQRRLRIEVFDPRGKRGLLSALPLPAPLHLGWSLLRYPHISWTDKLRAVKALLRIQREGFHNRRDLESRSFRDWLEEAGQSSRAIQNLWDLLVLPALNDASGDVSASAGFMLFKTALLKDRHAASVGYARAGLSEVMGNAVERRLREQGVTLVLGRMAEHLHIDHGAVAGVALTGGELVRADFYVSALMPTVLLGLLPEEWRRHPAFAPAEALTWSPIVNLHVWYDRPVADFDFAAFVESPVQWVFNKTRILGLPGPGQYLTVSLSGAWEHWPVPKKELADSFLPELARVLPGARDATAERFVVVKERQATFRPAPGSAPARLPMETPLGNLLLAGDWTDTGWPATMEGAVRSGNSAAYKVHDLTTR